MQTIVSQFDALKRIDPVHNLNKGYRCLQRLAHLLSKHDSSLLLPSDTLCMIELLLQWGSVGLGAEKRTADHRIPPALCESRSNEHVEHGGDRLPRARGEAVRCISELVRANSAFLFDHWDIFLRVDSSHTPSLVSIVTSDSGLYARRFGAIALLGLVNNVRISSLRHGASASRMMSAYRHGTSSLGDYLSLIASTISTLLKSSSLAHHISFYSVSVEYLQLIPWGCVSDAASIHKAILDHCLRDIAGCSENNQILRVLLCLKELLSHGKFDTADLTNIVKSLNSVWSTIATPEDRNSICFSLNEVVSVLPHSESAVIDRDIVLSGIHRVHTMFEGKHTLRSLTFTERQGAKACFINTCFLDCLPDSHWECLRSISESLLHTPPNTEPLREDFVNAMGKLSKNSISCMRNAYSVTSPLLSTSSIQAISDFHFSSICFNLECDSKFTQILEQSVQAATVPDKTTLRAIMTGLSRVIDAGLCGVNRGGLAIVGRVVCDSLETYWRVNESRDERMFPDSLRAAGLLTACGILTVSEELVYFQISKAVCDGKTQPILAAIFFLEHQQAENPKCKEATILISETIPGIWKHLTETSRRRDYKTAQTVAGFLHVCVAYKQLLKHHGYLELQTGHSTACKFYIECIGTWNLERYNQHIEGYIRSLQTDACGI